MRKAQKENNCKLENNFGNVYANILNNSIMVSKEDTVLGYIIPLSYIATPRMRNIREINKIESYDITNYIPKIGNEIEDNIYKKIYTEKEDNLFDSQDESGKELYQKLEKRLEQTKNI